MISMTTITSVQNPRVKDAVRLRDRRHREKQGRILIDGVRELGRAMGAGVKMLELFVCEPWCTSDDARQVLNQLAGCGGEVFYVSEAVFAKLAFGQRTEGVLGVAEMPQPTLDELDARIFPTAPPTAPEAPLIAILEGVEKPGNVGAVLRSADGAGISAVIVADGRTDLYNPSAIRASLGTIFALPVCAAEGHQTLAWLRQHGLRIVAARVEGSLPYTQLDYRGPMAIVLGSEAAGLSPAWSAVDITPIRVPMRGAADSLNVSATAAVLFYEARRQRG
jgi:TrmH family RNA methyltransferase